MAVLFGVLIVLNLLLAWLYRDSRFCALWVVAACINSVTLGLHLGRAAV